MEFTGRVQPRHVHVVRRCVSFGFWLLAASAAATLGLDVEFGPRV